MAVKKISCSDIWPTIGNAWCPRAKTRSSFDLSTVLKTYPLSAGQGFSSARRAWMHLTRGQVGHFDEKKSAPMDKAAFSFFKEVRSICLGESTSLSIAETLSKAFQEIIDTTPGNHPANPYQVLQAALGESKRALKDPLKPREKIEEMIGFLKGKIEEVAPGEKAKKFDLIPFESSDALKAATEKTLSISKKKLLLAGLILLAGGWRAGLVSRFFQGSISPINRGPLPEIIQIGIIPTILFATGSYNLFSGNRRGTLQVFSSLEGLFMDDRFFRVDRFFFASSAAFIADGVFNKNLKSMALGATIPFFESYIWEGIPLSSSIQGTTAMVCISPLVVKTTDLAWTMLEKLGSQLLNRIR